VEEDITTDLYVLESHLDGMLNRVQLNSDILYRLQNFERLLLSLNSLAEMIDFILRDTKHLLNLDVIGLCLVDPKAEIAQYLEDDNYDYKAVDSLFLVADDISLQTKLGKPIRPFLGIYEAESWDGFFPELALKPSSVVIAPLLRRGKCIGSLNLGSYAENRFSQKMATDFIQHVAAVIGICLENNLNFETLRHTSLIDPLTGLNNRRFLEQRLSEELDRGRRNRTALSCLFLDIDYFKRINDGYGHQAGDHVLAQVGLISKKFLRSNDVLARYGGEEFVALLCECDEKTAQDIAERIRANIAALHPEYCGVSIAVTVSIGVACCRPDLAAKAGMTNLAAELIKTADTALYAAKRNGRNRVESGGMLPVRQKMVGGL
jgi:diguanylate cyclase (GGDEF)-like protein